jgi:hypothetical protein
MTMEQQEYQTQVYHLPSMTVQNQFQYPDSPVRSSSPRAVVVSPSGSPTSTRQAKAANNRGNKNIAFDGDDHYIDSLKSSTDVYRERDANVRALALLNVQVARNGAGNGNGNGADDHYDLNSVSALTVRKAAILKYEQQQKERSALKTKTKLQGEIETFVKRGAPVLVAPSRRTILAETTRKVQKVVSEEDEGIDRIADYKCQLDLDREKEAMNKALRMLNGGSMY